MKLPWPVFQHGRINYHLWSTNGLLSRPLRPRSSAPGPGHLLCRYLRAADANRDMKDCRISSHLLVPPSPLPLPFLLHILFSLLKYVRIIKGAPTA